MAEEDTKKAAAEVDQGLKLVEIIERVQPRYTVTAEIKAGDLSYSADEIVMEPLVSIYDEVGEVELFSPIDATKKEQRAAREDVVADVAVEHTSVLLNIALAKAGLVQSKRALEDKDLERADRALVMVQRATIFEVDEVDLPLATVRENLFLAHTRMQNGDVVGARKALDVASERLKEYAKTAGDARAKEAKALRKEIDKYSLDSSSRAEGASASARVEKKILGWWDQVVQWWEE